MIPVLSSFPENSNIGFNNSWVKVQDGNNVRYAQMVYDVGGGGGGGAVGLAPASGSYDTIELDPPEKPTTITYKMGSTVIATVNVTYSGDYVSSVTRS